MVTQFPVLALLLAILAGCSASSEESLREWMAQERAQTRPFVKPLSEPKQYKPERYSKVGITDPYTKDKLIKVLARESATPADDSLIAPERARRKEALEAYPLDTMAMVGSLIKEGKPAALLKVDKLLYQVRIGNYLGQNYGRIKSITETEITLREIVQDAAGVWIERPTTLQLQEKLK
jgi:type IV pilus assembly protein PilP